MKTRSQNPRFFYDFKKNRTIMTREKELEKREPFHVVFIRNKEEEKEKKRKAKLKAEKM